MSILILFQIIEPLDLIVHLAILVLCLGVLSFCSNDVKDHTYSQLTKIQIRVAGHMELWFWPPGGIKCINNLTL